MGRAVRLSGSLRYLAVAQTVGMCAPGCPQAWVWLVLLGLAIMSTEYQTGVYAARPNNNRQKQKLRLHFVCKEGDDCQAWPVKRGRNAKMRSSNQTECGVARLKPSALQDTQMKTLQLANKSLGFNCKTISYMGVNKKGRVRRESVSRRGKFIGQTQSQYLNIEGNDNGKAEALSNAESSRAVVSGKSGMGQAQSQSVYDPSCDECLGGSDKGAENMRPDSSSGIALNNEGRFLTSGYNLNRPGTGPSPSKDKYDQSGAQNPSGTGIPQQQTWSTQQPSSSVFPGTTNYGIPNQDSQITGIPSFNENRNWLERLPNSSPQGSGVGMIPGQQNGPKGLMNINGPLPNNEQIDKNGQLPKNGPIDRYGQLPNNGPLIINGKISSNGPLDRNSHIPNNGPIERNGQIPNNNGPIERNGQIPNNNWPIERNGQIPSNNGPIERNGQIPNNNGPIERNGQIPNNNGPIETNGQIPNNNGPIERSGQIPNNNGPIERNGQIPNNNGPIQRNGQIPNSNRPIEMNGQIPNNGPIERWGQLPNNAPIDRITPMHNNNSPLERNGQIPNYAPVYSQTVQNKPDSFSQNNPDGSSKYPFQPVSDKSTGSILTNSMSPTRFGQSPESYYSSSSNSYNGNTGPDFFPGQISRTPALGDNSDKKNILDNNQYAQTFFSPGLTLPTQGELQTQNRKILPIPYGPSSTSFIGPNGETYLCCIVAPNQNGHASSTSPTGTQGQNIYPMQRSPEHISPYDSTGLQGTQNGLPGPGTLGPNYQYNQPGPSYGIRGQEANKPSIAGGSAQISPYGVIGDGTVPIGGTGSSSRGAPVYNSGGHDGYTSSTIPMVGGNGGPTGSATGTNPPSSLYYSSNQGYDAQFQNPKNTFTDGVQPGVYNSRGQEQDPYYNSRQGQNIYPDSSHNYPYDLQQQGHNTPLYGSAMPGTPHYTNNQNSPVTVSGGQNLPDQSSILPNVGSSQGHPYYNIGQSFPSVNNNGQEAPYSTSGVKNIAQIPFSPESDRNAQQHQRFPFGNVNGTPPQGGNFGGQTANRHWNNGTPYGTSSIAQGPGQSQDQTGSNIGGPGQTNLNTIGAQNPQVRPQGIVSLKTPNSGGLQGNLPGGGQYQTYDSVPNIVLPENQNHPGIPARGSTNMYPGAQTGLSNQQGIYNTGAGPNRDPTSPSYTRTTFNGTPGNVFDPNAIISDKDESEAEASITHNLNGTMAIASSKGGNERGRANTQVQGTYSGSGSFSAQAQITDEDKGAESQISGGKEGATSNAIGKGKTNKSQANVQLGSETGTLQTQSQSESSHHSTNSQVQGGVKGGMADAQARGPGSTSSQAQIGFTPYKAGDEAHKSFKTPFVGVGSANAQSNGKTGQSQSQLQGTFKYGITYNGAAQSAASLDKDAVFENRMPYKKIDVFQGEKNIEVDTEIPLPLPTLDTNDNEQISNENREHDHPHAVHHRTDEQLKNTTPNGITRSFDTHIDYEKVKDYEYEPNKEETNPDDYDSEGADPPEYYDEFPREQDTAIQHVSAAHRRNMDVQQTTRGNTQRIVLGNLQGQNADIVQKSSEQEPDYKRIYQPGERVPGTGGYIIPAGFTGSIQAISSRDKTIAVGSKESPSQAQTVSLTPGNGKINYVTAKPTQFSKSVNSNQLKSLSNNKHDANGYMTVTKSVSGALDEDNKIKKEYSHTYYTKSSSCGYFTFTCTMVRGSNGTQKVCKPKIPTNPDGTPIKC